MKRWLFNLGRASCAIPFLITLASWLFSYIHPGNAHVVRDWFTTSLFTERTLRVNSAIGGLHLEWSSIHAEPADVAFPSWPVNSGEWRSGFDRSNPEYPQLTDEVDTRARHLIGIHYGHTDSFIHGAWRRGYQWEFIVPYAYLLLLTACPASYAIIALRCRRPRKSGLCPNCHYDLRAHHPGDRCSECGTPIPFSSQNFTT